MLVICGAMKTAKSLQLIQEIELRKLSGAKVVVLKHTQDTREKTPVIASRFAKIKVPAKVIGKSRDIVTLCAGADFVAIDEAQFFDNGLVVEIIKLRQRSDVAVSGLDLDFRGLPFGSMPQLMAMASKVVKLSGVCDQCGSRAGCLSQRLYKNKPASAFDPDIVVDKEKHKVTYELRCLECYTLPSDINQYLKQHA